MTLSSGSRRPPLGHPLDQTPDLHPIYLHRICLPYPTVPADALLLRSQNVCPPAHASQKQRAWPRCLPASLLLRPVLQSFTRGKAAAASTFPPARRSVPRQRHASPSCVACSLSAGVAALVAPKQRYPACCRLSQACSRAPCASRAECKVEETWTFQ